MNAPMTTHAKAQLERGAVLAQQAEEAARRAAIGEWRYTLGKPLPHSIRYTLDVDLPRDIAWIESCRDTEGEELLAVLRCRFGEMRPSDWAHLRMGTLHVWRVLVAWMRQSSWRDLRPKVHPGRTTETQARELMAAFCNAQPGVTPCIS